MTNLAVENEVLKQRVANREVEIAKLKAALLAFVRDDIVWDMLVRYGTYVVCPYCQALHFGAAHELRHWKTCQIEEGKRVLGLK